MYHTTYSSSRSGGWGARRLLQFLQESYRIVSYRIVSYRIVSHCIASSIISTQRTRQPSTRCVVTYIDLLGDDIFDLAKEIHVDPINSSTLDVCVSVRDTQEQSTEVYARRNAIMTTPQQQQQEEGETSKTKANASSTLTLTLTLTCL
jgi:hypothetical protein